MSDEENIFQRYMDDVSKYELLCTIKKVFNKDIKINKKELGKDKCLIGTITTNSIVEQLEELKEYYYDN